MFAANPGLVAGAAIYQPENLLKLPNVSFEGLVSGYTKKVGEGIFNKPCDDFVSGDTTVHKFMDNDQLKAAFTSMNIDVDDDERARWLEERVYSGAVYRRKLTADNQGSAMWELYTKNTGHLGVLDHPEQVDRLHGMHKFTGAAVRV